MSDELIGGIALTLAVAIIVARYVSVRRWERRWAALRDADQEKR